MRTVTVSATFASTHQDDYEGPHLHGHTFHVQAVEVLPNGGDRGTLHQDLLAVVSELHLRRLDEMLIGGVQTLEGIGSWIMERLILRHQRLASVEVWTADLPAVRVGVTREIR